MKNGVRRSSFNLESSEWSNVTEVPLPSLSQMVGYKRLEVFNEASMHAIPLFCPLIAYEIEFYVKLIIQSIMSPFLQISEEYSVIFPLIVKYDWPLWFNIRPKFIGTFLMLFKYDPWTPTMVYLSREVLSTPSFGPWYWTRY